MCGDDFEPVEVLDLRDVAVNERRNEYGGAFGGRRLAGDPADVLVGKVAAFRKLDFRACEAAAVHLHYVLNAGEFNAGGQGFEHFFGAGGLNLEVRQATVLVLLEDVDTFRIPLFELTHR